MLKSLCGDLFAGLERTCLHCTGQISPSARPDKKFCSTRCYQRHWYDRPPFPYVRDCKTCNASFVVSRRDDANRKYCSQNCSRRAQQKGIGVWNKLHPGKLKEYRDRSLAKNPTRWADERRKQRKQILTALGGECVACHVKNPNWLHVDYIPTTRNERFRHSRTLKFTLANLHLFRILCANHHYELTLTGKIEGTSIVQ